MSTTDNVDPAEFPAYPMARGCPLHPPAEYADLSTRRPVSRAVLPSGKPVWLVASHELVKEILTDPRVSANRFLGGFPHQFRRVQTAAQQTEQMKKGSAVIGRAFGVDGPEHAERKRLVVPEFTVRRVQAFRPRIQEIVDDVLDEMVAAGSPAELMSALALPVPSRVICELLDVPQEDRQYFLDRTTTMVDQSSTVEQRLQANLDVLGKLDGLIKAKEADPADDVLGRIVRRNVELGVLSHDEIVGVAAFLLISGFETTANMISMGTLGLLENPGQLELLIEDPGLAGSAVDELLRYFSVSDPAGSRVALEDIEIGGVTIPAGEGVIALAGAANWDPSVFDEPERLDIRRKARGHLAFGHGAHQCIGLHLARLELEVVFGTLFQRLPGLRVTAPVDDLRYKVGANIYGVHEVPVAW
ncbi:cytochrome P450 [Amycolatopsis sp. EV170708-02-1]|uniref:cytochrome P450 n=1 Tax=Amycolatopsis sp. EV170708-02-1 TaxID=2919322 RepID=UPI001F0BDE45|nr:cytochrome P450 [Amycolatopsis sp. EV170708-02-1]UMP03499.1 NmvO [Amycolatopsis sp. EV170708-02-1]